MGALGFSLRIHLFLFVLVFIGELLYDLTLALLMVARGCPVVCKTLHRIMLVLEERATEEKAVLDGELLWRLFKVQVVFNLVSPFATMHVATVETLPEIVAGVGGQRQR